MLMLEVFVFFWRMCKFLTSIFSFSHNILYSVQNKFHFWVTFMLSSVLVSIHFNFSKMLLFGKGLNSRTLANGDLNVGQVMEFVFW